MNTQLDIFPSKETPNAVVELPNGKLQYFEHFFDKLTSDSYFSILLHTIAWQQDQLTMYGKELLQPRLSAWYGDPTTDYSYSGVQLSPLPWTPALLEIKKAIEVVSPIKFNSVLLNRYRNGNDSISWHSDAEPELGENPVIGSVNFGATRRFMLRHKKDKSLTYEVELKHGSYLMMYGEMQHFWMHQVPKEKKVVNERINLTFRVIK